MNMHQMSAPQHQAPPQYVGSPPTMMAGSAPQMNDGGNPQMQGPPLNIGGPNILGHPGAGIANPMAQPSSLPWTVGSTDGTYATMTLMQQRNQHQHQQLPQQQPAQQQQGGGGGAPWNPGGGGEGSPSVASMSLNSTSLARQRNQLQGGVAPWNPGGRGGPPSGAPMSSNSPSLSQQRNQQQQQQGGAPWNPGGGGGPPGASILSTSPPTQVGPNTGAAIGAAGQATATNNLAQLAAVQSGKSIYHDLLFHQPSASVEAVLSASCEVMGFDISEMWLRTGPKTHQLTNSHLRPTALEDSVRKQLVEVYYGDKSSERTHRLSPALCKRAKDANDVVWVTAHTPHGEEALRCSISNVRTAVAVPVCHEASNTNITIIYFSIRRIIMRPTAVEFLVHLSLSAAVASVNALAEEGLMDRDSSRLSAGDDTTDGNRVASISRSEHVPAARNANAVITHQRVERYSVTGAQLDLVWRQLHNVEYLTDGGNSWIHTSVFNGKPVVVKTLKPECQDVALAINEIEGELAIHSRLNHPNIVDLIGAGSTSKGVRFVVLERLDGGTLTQMLGYDTRIRDRRRRFWRKKQFAYQDVLKYARAIASAMQYCHEEAIPGTCVLHRDLKPDNIGFTLNGTVKLIDFGLARLLENADATSNEVYAMSGETGSLRYMAPEVAEALPYNCKADVYSFGVILWELNSMKKPFEGLNRELFYERVVHGGERPVCSKKWPVELTELITGCWSAEIEKRPAFRTVVERIDALLAKEKQGGSSKKPFRRISGLIDRHSTWF